MTTFIEVSGHCSVGVDVFDVGKMLAHSVLEALMCLADILFLAEFAGDAIHNVRAIAGNISAARPGSTRVSAGDAASFVELWTVRACAWSSVAEVVSSWVAKRVSNKSVGGVM